MNDKEKEIKMLQFELFLCSTALIISTILSLSNIGLSFNPISDYIFFMVAMSAWQRLNRLKAKSLIEESEEEIKQRRKIKPLVYAL